MSDADSLVIGIDAGTSVMKAVAFTLAGAQIDVAARPNRYTAGADGSATQDMDRTWADCAATLRELAERIPGLARRTAAIAVTGQGDGTWLVGAGNRPVGEAWLWLDARAAARTERLRRGPGERTRFETTGTGLSTCQQGPQLAEIAATEPERLARAETAMHCKDWLFLNLTGIRASDPSEASLGFGDFRTRAYDDSVIAALGLSRYRRLLPTIIDGSEQTCPLDAAAAAATGLRAGTPVSLGFMDIVSSGLGAGVYTRDTPAACTIIGSTGIHMRAVRNADFHLNAEGTGYAIALPVPGLVAQIQSNMAATLNLDWVLTLAADIAGQFGERPAPQAVMGRIEAWLEASAPGAMLYHPYISDAGERGPFIDPQARASFIGLRMGHRFADLVRAVIEGLGMAGRDCYAAMGEIPADVRLSGGAARSPGLRRLLSAAIGAPVRISARGEAGAAGAAMMAAVAIGAYRSMDDCLDEWVVPRLGALESPDPRLTTFYARHFDSYRVARDALPPVWSALASERSAADLTLSAAPLPVSVSAQMRKDERLKA
ncbi:erythritol kinase [Endobacter medicaginis]|uniref:Erythritol kinase n=4 Tax=Endobacter medicaginis TaxID=1181271 RepID=A0A839UQ71_9PROT|nr:FGGY-family carbohydrate kinase [Endobacter medicaginis]MBB3172338.1 erythritol kinase [Endobacter medicaginis]MCX5476688.1 carbohydrate kinase [Endobacter medicaginis]